MDAVTPLGDNVTRVKSNQSVGSTQSSFFTTLGSRNMSRSARDAKLLVERRQRASTLQNGKEPDKGSGMSSAETKQFMESIATKLDSLLLVSTESKALLEDALSNTTRPFTSKFTSPSGFADMLSESDCWEDEESKNSTAKPQEERSEQCEKSEIQAFSFSSTKAPAPLPNVLQAPEEEPYVIASDQESDEDLDQESDPGNSVRPGKRCSHISEDGETMLATSTSLPSCVSTPQTRASSKKKSGGVKWAGDVDVEKKRVSTHSAGSRNSMHSNATISNIVQNALRRHPILYELWRLMEDPGSVKYGTSVTFCIDMIIILSVMFAFLQLTDVWIIESSTTKGLELGIDILFTVEALLRFVVCPNHLLFLTYLFNVIDVLAGVPPVVLRVLDLVLTENSAIVENTLVCIVPILRLLKFMRRFEKFHLLLKAFQSLLDALPVLLYPLTVVLLSFSALLFIVEPRSNIPNLGTSLYATSLTLTTVGYGDVTPESAWGQSLMCCLSIVSTLYLAIPLGIIGHAFSTVWEERDTVLLMQRTTKTLREMNLTARDIPSLFKFFDKDKDGHLSVGEFHDMVSDMRLGISSARIMDLFRLIDKDGSGKIDDEEFMRTFFPVTHQEMYSRRSSHGHHSLLHH